MPIRVPAGRGGRIWLRERIALAERAADLLEQKRRALVGEARRLQHLADTSRDRWETTCHAAETWAFRASLIGGQRQFDLAAQLSPPAEARITWRSTMGVVYPFEASCELGGRVDIGGLAETSALSVAAGALRTALVAAVEHAAAQHALDLVTRETDATTRRLRAIERRWIPRLYDRLHEVNRRLEDQDREVIVRARWVRDHTSGRSSA